VTALTEARNIAQAVFHHLPFDEVLVKIDGRELLFTAPSPQLPDAVLDELCESKGHVWETVYWSEAEPPARYCPRCTRVEDEHYFLRCQT
jgi:hypothetical protein